MRARRVLIPCLPIALFALSACSSNDTVVALNVSTTTSTVPVLSSLRVTITQDSEAPVVVNENLAAVGMLAGKSPTTTVQLTDDAGNDAGQEMFAAGTFPPMRITLPSSWNSDVATVQVQAFDAAGNPYLGTVSTQVNIRPQGAVAAFVMVGPQPASMDGGVDGGDAETTPAADATTDGAEGPDSGAVGAADAEGADAHDGAVDQ